MRRNGDGRAFAVYPDTGGRRAYFGRYGTQEAENAYREWLSAVLLTSVTGEPAGKRRPSVTLAELAVDYLAWSDVNHSRGEARNNRETIVRLLDPYCGDLPAIQFGPNALRGFQQHLATSGRFARNTVNSHVKRVRRFLRWCQSRELLPPGTVQELDLVEPLRTGRTTAHETPPVAPVPRDVWTRTLPFLRPTIRAMVQVQYWTGTRPGEVCALRPCDIDRTHEVWLYRPERHKTTHKGRTLIKAVPPPAQAILEPFLCGPADRPVFVTIRRRVYSTLTYGAAIRRAAKRAREHGVDVPDWSPNQLRHAILTEIRDRLGVAEAQAWAGHSESATTAIYTWTATAELRRIAAALGSPDVPPQ